VKPWEKLGTTITPDGSWLELRHHDGEYVIAADGYDLMTSRQHVSEDAMMSLACPNPGPGVCILIGGLGMGFTLRATLDLLPPTGSVVVAELVQDVIEWNRGPLAHLANHPLDDPRVTVAPGDVGRAMRDSDRRFDAILLDVDNGPDALTQRTNGWLYGPAGLEIAKRALKPKGGLAVWSVGNDVGFERRLTVAGFQASTHRLSAHGTGHKRFFVFIGRKA
jgi:spermidine synthase